MSAVASGSKFHFEQVKHPVLWLGLLMIIAILIKAIVSGDLGQLGKDSDDALRYVQITDFLNGQSWFHTDQYRMGLSGGTDMHWSRIPDIPIILLTKIFDLFMPQELALKWAYSIWPLMTVGLFIFAMTTAARFWGGSKTLVFTLALLAFFVLKFHRFEPGSIDHHNIQMALVALAMAFALDPKVRASSFFVSGFAVAAFVAIGVEVYLFAAVICAYVAVTWALRGEVMRSGALGYGLGMASGLALAFLATISPSEYGLVYCDALSLITLSAGGAGALGLATAAKYLSGKMAIWRWGGIAAVGVACLVILAFQAPQCLANPLEALPDDVVNLWLNGIQEAKPLISPENSWLTDIPYLIGAPLLGLTVLLFNLWKRRVWDARCLIAGLLISAIGLTIYQVRFFPFAYMFALIPLAAWTAKTFIDGRKKSEGNVLYLFCLVLSVQIFWSVPGILFGNNVTAKDKIDATAQASNCYGNDVLTQLNKLPAGVLSANSNGTGKILMHTKHRVLSGNYHRNWEGIITQIRIGTSRPEDAYKLLVENEVDYLYYCKWDTETRTFISKYENGLFAKISTGTRPAYLEHISDNLAGENIQIFKVVR